MYSVSETIEDENLCVSAHAAVWVKDDILFWPPTGSGIDRSKITLPGSDWKQFKCRVLRENIETFQEALDVERMYSKHRDSNSFRKEQDRKKLKRDHPINANVSGLIDVNSLINEIDKNTGKVATKTSTPNTGAEHSKRPQISHKQCFEKSKKDHAKKGFGIGSRECNRISKKTSNSKSSKAEKSLGKSTARDSDPKIPRYPNYLKSGQKSSAPSATITKEQFLNQNGIDEMPAGKTVAISEDVFVVPSNSTQRNAFNIRNIEYDVEGTQISTKITSDKRRFSLSDQEGSVYCGFDGRVEQGSSDAIGKFTAEYQSRGNIHEGNTSFERSVLSHLIDIKNAQKKSEENRLLFEARMVVKLDTAVNIILQSQGQNRGQVQQPEAAQSADPVQFTEEDFEELDKNYPITLKRKVEELEWSLRHDLDFKFLMKSRINEFVGEDPKKAVREIMKYLLTDQVLDLYTWCGTEKLQAFKRFVSINNLIFQTISGHCKKFKREHYGSYMVQWLKHSTTRQRTVTYTYPKQRKQKSKPNQYPRLDEDDEGDKNDGEEDDEDGESDNDE